MYSYKVLLWPRTEKYAFVLSELKFSKYFSKKVFLDISFWI